MSVYQRGFSPQTTAVYQLFLKRKTLTISKISIFLSIKPQGVYRILDHLEENGFISKTKDGKDYQVKPVDEAIDSFLLSQRNWFLENIIVGANKDRKILREQNELDVSVILDRDKLMRKYTEDLRTAKNRVDLIVIGLPIGIPAETLMEEVSAVKRGVVFRELAQEVNQKNKEMLLIWIKNGIHVKKTESVGVHFILIDDTISYVGVFDEENKEKRVLTRFVNRHINKQLEILFERYWKKAKSI